MIPINLIDQKKTDLKNRLITALILIPIIIAVLFFLPPFIFIFITIAICILSAWEWGQLARINLSSHRICLPIFCGLILIIIMFILSIYPPSTIIWLTQYILWTALSWWSVALLLILYYPSSAKLWCKSRLLMLIFGILTLLPFFWGIVILRQYNYNVNYITSSWWLLYIMILIWSIDSSAYVFGCTLGRHKLAPKISPNKTWEGFFSSLITSTIIAWIFSKYSPLNTTLLILIIYSIAITLASVLGDLTESMFKREAGIKNSSCLIPGHGGILDRIDSFTAAVPVFTYLMLLFS